MKPDDLEVELMMEKLYGSALAHLDSSDYALAVDRLTEMMQYFVEEETELEEALVVKPRAKEDLPGWYQDVEGNLYKYDGVVWDVVPDSRAGKLEFLG